MIFHSMHKDNFTPIALNVFLDGKTLITYHQHHFESYLQWYKQNQNIYLPSYQGYV
jgi:magnesium transporter